MNVVASTRSAIRATMRKVRDAADPDGAEARKLAQAQAELKVRNRLNDLKWLMGDPKGRRFVYELLDACGFQGSTVNEYGRPSAIMEGRRTVAIQLAQEIASANPDAWLTMYEEALHAVRA